MGILRGEAESRDLMMCHYGSEWNKIDNYVEFSKSMGL